LTNEEKLRGASILTRCDFVRADVADGIVLHAAPQQQALPSAFEKYVTATVRPTAHERQTLMSGGPITKLLESDASKEVAVFGAVWINGSRADYVRKVKDIENFERGGAFRVTKRISDPPRLDDFTQLELPADDVKDLRSCKVGDCEIKLGAKSLNELRADVHWGTPGEKAEAEAVFRRRALEYVTAYRQGGISNLRFTATPTILSSWPTNSIR
jgi:hypothetical protein